VFGRKPKVVLKVEEREKNDSVASIGNETSFKSGSVDKCLSEEGKIALLHSCCKPVTTLTDIARDVLADML
jgi:hypothetical protein